MTLKVSVKKWRKYAARKDVKKNWWFKLSNQIFDDDEIYDLTGNEFKVWIYVLCQCSKKGVPDPTVNVTKIISLLRVTENEIFSALDKLSSFQIVSYTRNGLVTDPDRKRICRGEERRGEKSKSINTFTSTALETSSNTGAIDDLKGEGEIEKFLVPIKHDTQRRWLMLYEVEYIKSEIIKAVEWLDLNPRKNPRTDRGRSQFITNWLSRGWDRYRKGIATNARDDFAFLRKD